MATIVVRYVWVVAFVLSSIPGITRAQAWVEAPGTISVGVFHEIYWGGDYLFNSDALDGTSIRGEVFDGNRIYLGEIRSHTERLTLDYAVRERLGISASLAYVTARYRGPSPWNLDIDDGDYHSSLQDARVELRYQADTPWLTITPLLGALLPLTDYESTGHSPVGGGLSDFEVGLYVGKIGFPLRGTYLHGAAIHRWLEEADGRRMRMSNLALEFGWSPLPRLIASTSLSHQDTRGGYEWYEENEDSIHGENSELPINLSNARFTRVALALDYSIWGDMAIATSWTSSVWGENLTDADYFSAGLTYRFRAPWAGASMWE